MADTILLIVGSLKIQSSNYLFENSSSLIKYIIENEIIEDISPLTLYSLYIGMNLHSTILIQPNMILPIYKTVN